MKVCIKCKENKEEVEFGNLKASKDGLNCYCKRCKSLKEKAYRKANPEAHEKQKVKNRIRSRKRRRDFKHMPKDKFNNYKSKAKARNINFNLTFDEFMIFWNEACSYCGSEIATIGIDRRDNSVGYNTDNCCSCCHKCNWMKRHLDLEEWLSHVKQIAKHMGLFPKSNGRR